MRKLSKDIVQKIDEDGNITRFPYKEKLSIDEELIKVIDMLLYIVDRHYISDVDSLEKFIYINSFSESNFMVMKKMFTIFGEHNIYKGIIDYKNHKIKKRKKYLIEKIKEGY